MPEPTSPLETLSYEQALQELEEIVHTLEESQLPLEQSLQLFERGQALALRCSALLEGAELRIRQLTGQEPDTLAES
jgi:exodeoxyribonuclease VII small subunit